MTKKQKKMLVRIIISFIILAGEMIFFHVSGVDIGIWELVAYLVPYLIIGYDILRKAILGIIHLQVFDECFLMTIATIGAFATREYSEGTAVMLFYQVGELFQSYAVNKSRKSITELMDIRPDYANIENEIGELEKVDPEEVECGSVIVIKPGEKVPLDGVVVSGASTVDTSALTGESIPRNVNEGNEIISGSVNLSGIIRVKVTKAFGESTVSKILELMDIRPDYANIENEIGELEKVDPEEVECGSVIVIKPGEKVPLDGVVVSGASTVDTSALTGESIPRNVNEGNEIISGSVNLSGIIRVKVTKAFGESTVSKILELVENSQEKKSKSENFITKFSRYYTPAVVIGALLLAVIPSIITGDPRTWIYRAMTFLVISCPCALVISIPLSFFSGIGGASKVGVLIKGGNYLEALASAGIAVFDKTGTLTKGSFEVTAVHPDSIDETALLEIACLAECYSDHPISLSLKRAWGKECDTSRISGVTEVAGQGVKAVIDGKNVAVGNLKLMNAVNAEGAHDCHKTGTAVHVAVDGVYKGHIIISDSLKDGAAEAIRDLKQLGIRKTVMLTGDDRRVGADCAKTLGIDEYHAELLPADKVDCVEKLLSEKQEKETLVFVGDGINDAPVLTRADIGIAMGAMGSDAAIEAADIVLMDDNPHKIATAMKIARKTISIVHQNIVFALGVKALILILGALGMADMWGAVFADVGVSIIAILNAMRAMRVAKEAK